MYVRKINEIQIIFGMKETIAVFSLNIYKLGHGQVNGTLFSLAFFSHSSHGSTSETKTCIKKSCTQRWCKE